MMKRQLLRVKQIADQTFQRGEKTEVLTDELTIAEKRVEVIKQACQNSGKKLSSCMQRLAWDGASTDKRSPKKTPEALLAQCMEEWGLTLGENSILGMTMIDSARLQETLAEDLLHYKTEVEESVVEPLQNILKVDIANITKCRKQLAKLTAEMDASKLRYQTAFKNCQQTSSNALATAVAKADVLKEESEDAATKVDQCRDILSAEMFNLISREPELSKLYVKLCRLQLEYHKNALAALESTVPELEAQINNCPHHPVFGVALEDHLHYTNREIAVVIERCVCWLLETAMNEEGLFRIGGSVTKIKKIKSAFDAGVYLTEDERDHNNIAGVLKLYLRSLPEPLLTYTLYDEWMKAASIREHDEQLQALWSVVNSLPEANKKNLRYLVKFFSKLCQISEVNKMSSQNIAIVVGPNLLWSPIEESVLGMNMTATNIHSSIIDILIRYADWFFPGDCEFHISTPTSPRHLNSFSSSLRGSQLSLSTNKVSTTDSAVDSLSSSPANSPKSPRGVVLRPKKKSVAPIAPNLQNNPRYSISRSVSCGTFQQNGSTTGHNPRSKSESQHQSASHEDLLTACQDDTKNPELNNGDTKPVVKPPRTKSKTNVLPPVMEKVNPRNSLIIERPTVPPPERPPRPANIISTSLIDFDQINLNVVNSENKQERVDSLSYMDDSDFEDDDSKLVFPDSPKSKDSADIESVVTGTPEPVGTGTPKLLEHYNGNCRQSNSIWFSQDSDPKTSPTESHNLSKSEDNNNESCLDSSQHCDPNQFCTIIPVGNGENGETESDYKPLHKFSPPKDAPIKLRVNSIGQNTKL